MDMLLSLLPQAIAIGLVNGSIYVLVALGLTLVYGILHIVNFAHGEVFMLGAMGAFYLYGVLGVPLVVVLLLICAGALVLGFMVERTLLRPLRGRWVHLVVATLGLSIAVQSLSWIAFGVEEKNIASYYPGVVSFLGIRIAAERLLAAGLSAVLVAGLYWVVFHTKFGLAMRAIEESEDIARTLGIDPNKISARCVAIGFSLAALGGAMIAPIYSINPGMGLEVILISFLVVIIGGLGSIGGTMVSGLLVGVIQSVGSLLLGSATAYGLLFSLMVLILVVRPSGLLGRA